MDSGIERRAKCPVCSAWHHNDYNGLLECQEEMRRQLQDAKKMEAYWKQEYEASLEQIRELTQQNLDLRTLCDSKEASNALLSETVDALKEGLKWAKAGDAATKAARAGWIPVTEHLPQDVGTYLIASLGGIVSIADWFGDKWSICRECNGFSRYEITHWQPLPSPPE